MAASGLWGRVTVWGSMPTGTGRASFQRAALGSTIGPAPLTRAATIGVCAAAAPDRARTAPRTTAGMMALVGVGTWAPVVNRFVPSFWTTSPAA